VKARFVAEITEPVLMTFVESGDSTFVIAGHFPRGGLTH
jgi:hypothetical protein